MTSTSDLSESGLERLVKDALELADLCESDPLMGPAPSELIGHPPYPDLDLFDDSVASIDAKEALDRATRAEKAALDSDPRITLSEGATFSRTSSVRALVLSGGFEAVTRGSYASLSVVPVVEDEGGKKRRGYYWTAKRHLMDLEDETFVGQEATRRTLAKLGARKVPTGTLPIVFDADSARSILGTFAGPLLGSSLAQIELSPGSDRHQGRKPPGHHHRRSARRARARFPKLRRRGPRLPSDLRGEGWDPRELSLGLLLGAQARARADRQRLARRWLHRSLDHELHSGRWTGEPGGGDRPHRARPPGYGDDGLRLQRDHGGLLARCGRLPHRGRSAQPPGERGDHFVQPRSHAAGHRSRRQRPRAQELDRFADLPGRRHDGVGQLVPLPRRDHVRATRRSTGRRVGTEGTRPIGGE